MASRDADDLQSLQREVARARDFLERIVEAASNPDCFSCAEVRRLGHQALNSAPPFNDWQT